MFNSIVIPLDRYQIDVFTWGEASLLGYENSRETLLRLHSFVDVRNYGLSRYRLAFSSSHSPVRRLILNSEETIVALLTDDVVYLVNLPGDDAVLSPLAVGVSTRPIDLLWLRERDYFVVHSSQCDLYVPRGSTWQCFRSFPTTTTTREEKSRPRISLRQSIDIVQVSLVRREKRVFVFALKANGEIYVLALADDCRGDFVGPLPFSPSKFDNYGADHSQSKMFALCSSTGSIVVVLSNARSELIECLFLNETLYNLDTLVFPSIRSVLVDRVNSPRYYLLDGQSSVYSIDLLWIDQLPQLPQTKIEKLIHGDDLPIEQIALIQTNSQGQCLALINKQRKVTTIGFSSNICSFLS